MAKLGNKVPADPDRAGQNKAEVRGLFARRAPRLAAALERVLLEPLPELAARAPRTSRAASRASR